MADDCVFEYNIVKNCYDVNENHDDGFQSWTTMKNEDGSKKAVKNITLRGNIFINFNLSSREEALSGALIREALNNGYKAEFFDSKPGDSREMMDYGSEAYIKVSWGI